MCEARNLSENSHAVIPEGLPESIIRKPLFGAGLDSGLKTAGMTEKETGGILGQAPRLSDR